MSIGGTQNLGGAQYTITANAVDFMKGMHAAQQQAQQSTQRIQQSMQQMAAESQRQTKAMVMGFAQLGGVIDDAQYGFRAIANQIQPMGQQIAAALGASTTAAMAFGGAVGILGTGINQLINHWQDLKDRMQSAFSGTPVEELRKIREAAEQAGEAFAKMRGTPTRAAARGVKGLQEAIVETPAEELQVEVVKAMAGTEHATPFPVMQARFIRQLEKVRDAARSPERAAEAQRKIDQYQLEARRIQIEGDRKKAEQLIGGAVQPGAEGEPARARLRELNKRNPGILNSNVIAALQAAEPAQVKRQEAFEKQLEVKAEVQRRIRAAEAARQQKLEEQLAGGHRLVEAREAAEKERKEKADKQNARSELLNQQGQANEDEWRRGQEGERHRLAAGFLRGAFGREMLGGGARGARPLADRMQDALKGMGAGNFRPQDVLGDMRKTIEERVAQVMAERGVDRRTAEKAVLADATAPERHMRRQVQDIMKGSRPEHQKAEFVDVGEFWKKTQQDIFNNGHEYQKRSVDALEKIVKLLEDNPAMAEDIQRWAMQGGLPGVLGP